MAVGGIEIELRLQVQPELRVGAEPMPEAKGRVARDGALAGDDLRDAVGRNVDLPRERRRADPQFFQFIPEDNARVNGSHEHRTRPFVIGDSPRSQHRTAPAGLRATRNRRAALGCRGSLSHRLMRGIPIGTGSHIHDERNAEGRGVLHLFAGEGFGRVEFVFGDLEDEFVVDLEEEART